MTKPRDPEALLAAYLAVGMDVLPVRVVDSVLDEVHRTRQRAVFGPWTTRSFFKPSLAAAALVVVVALGGAFAVVVGPSPTTSAHPSPSLPGVVPPSSTPSATLPNLSTFPRTTGVWIATGTMGTPRFGHSSVRLLDGRVLVVGGAGGESDPSSAELYQPDTGAWTATGTMLKPHDGFPATLLRDGRLLVGDADDPAALDPIFGAEVYDPDSGTWAATGRMVKANPGFATATLLRDGKVLVTGSDGTSSQLYDPLSGTWTSAGKMVTPSRNHAATLLPDGKVLVVGGFDVSNDDAFASAELYDPATGIWTAIAPMLGAKGSITATLLPDGNVLVMGETRYRPPTPPELYDTATGTWTAIGDLARPGSATLLSDGMVLVTDELYDPATGSWTTTGSMLRAYGQAPATLLLDGTVLVTGGMDCPPTDGVCTGTSSAELYVPAGVSPPSAVVALPITATTPSPTPSPTPVPPQAGPVPPGARTWKVTVMNKSSRSATLFVAEEDEHGLLGPLVGSATPNVVAAGATVKVTFLLPAKGTGWAIFVNPGPNAGPVAGPAEMSLPGQIYINPSNQPGWLSP
jgi:hypothetical protein